MFRIFGRKKNQNAPEPQPNAAPSIPPLTPEQKTIKAMQIIRGNMDDIQKKQDVIGSFKYRIDKLTKENNEYMIEAKQLKEKNPKDPRIAICVV